MSGSVARHGKSVWVASSAGFYPEVKFKHDGDRSNLRCLYIVELERSRVGRFRNRIIKQARGLVLEVVSHPSNGDSATPFNLSKNPEPFRVLAKGPIYLSYRTIEVQVTAISAYRRACNLPSMKT